jgi:methyl-accepting chemotaxis protein
LCRETTAASNEQNTGAAQIAKAVQQLDQVIQQNAAASEEIAATAEELQSQAVQLQSTIAFFKVENGGDSLARTAVTHLKTQTKRTPKTNVAHITHHPRPQIEGGKSVRVGVTAGGESVTEELPMGVTLNLNGRHKGDGEDGEFETY